MLTRGARAELDGDLGGGYYVQPTIFEGDNSMRVFQEEIFGPVVSVTSFDDEADAVKIANDTLYGLGAGVWSRDGARQQVLGLLVVIQHHPVVLATDTGGLVPVVFARRTRFRLDPGD